MSAPHTTDTPHPERWVHPELGGVYLTDEVFLYRVVSLERDGLDDIAELEDCFGLDVVFVSVRELSARQLRVVTPAPTEREHRASGDDRLRRPATGS